MRLAALLLATKLNGAAAGVPVSAPAGAPHCQGRVLTQVTIQGPATAVCKGQVPQSPVMVRYNDRDNAAPGPAGWPWAVTQTPGHWQNAPQARRGPESNQGSAASVRSGVIATQHDRL
jgi:hypothetical protein